MRGYVAPVMQASGAQAKVATEDVGGAGPRSSLGQV